MRSVRLLSLAFLTSSLVSCGAPAVHTPVSAEARRTPTPASAAVIDTSAVARPEDLFAAVRIKSGALVLEFLRGAGQGIPKSVTASAIAQTLLGPALADIVDIDKPIDIGMFGDEDHPEFVVSLAITSLDDAKRNLVEDFKLESSESGVIDLAPRAKSTAEAASPPRCELRPAAGAEPYRLVCTAASKSLGGRGAYLTRSFARAPTGPSFHAEMFATAPLRAAITSAPTKSRGEEMWKEAVAKSLVDSDALNVDVDITSNGADVSVDGKFRSHTSPFTRIAQSQREGSPSIAELFWRLPADADAAVASRGANEEDLVPVRALAHEIEALERRPWMSPDVADRQMKAFLSVFLTGGPVAVAYGFDETDAIAAIKAAKSPAKIDRARAFAGWTMAGVEEPSSRWVDALRELVKVDAISDRAREADAAKKSVKGQVERETETTKADRAKDEPKAEGSFNRIFEERVSDTKLPAGTAHFALRARPAATRNIDAKKAPALPTHIYVVPNGALTWIAIGDNERQLVTKIHGVLADDGHNGLGGRTDLQALHTSTGFIGFVSVPFFDALMLEDNTDAKRDEARATLLGQASSPTYTTKPVPFWIAPNPRGSDDVELRIHLPTAVMHNFLARMKLHTP